MAGEWRRYNVSELIEKEALAIGDGYRAKNAELSRTGLPFARASNIGNGFHFSDADCFPEDQTYKVGEKISRPGDVVFTSKGTVGRFAFVRDDTPRFVYSPQLCYWRSLDKEILDARFLYCWMTSREFFIQFKSVAGQTDMAEYVSLRDQRLMYITAPPLADQRAIAHILGTLDDKIELNRRMSQTLEAMARALFKSWFVDFDPVRAKIQGRDTGLPKHIADLFPDRLVDSELGEIPEAWEVSTIGECFDLTMGQSPPGSTYNEHGEGIPFFQGKTDFGFRYPSNRRYCTVPIRIALADDTLVSVRAPVGDINMSWERCCLGRGVAALRHKSGSSSYTYYAIGVLQPEIQQYEHTGTVFGAITKKQFVTLRAIEPPLELTKLFDVHVMPLDQQIRNATAEIDTLTALRDTLLPKLISGELLVKHTTPLGAAL